MYGGCCTLIGLEIFFSNVRVLQLISCTRPYHSVEMSHFISYMSAREVRVSKVYRCTAVGVL